MQRGPSAASSRPLAWEAVAAVTGGREQDTSAPDHPNVDEQGASEAASRHTTPTGS